MESRHGNSESLTGLFSTARILLQLARQEFDCPLISNADLYPAINDNRAFATRQDALLDATSQLSNAEEANLVYSQFRDSASADFSDLLRKYKSQKQASEVSQDELINELSNVWQQTKAKYQTYLQQINKAKEAGHNTKELRESPPLKQQQANIKTLNHPFLKKVDDWKDKKDKLERDILGTLHEIVVRLPARESQKFTATSGSPTLKSGG